MKRVAVFAHFDVDNQVDEHVINTIKEVAAVADKVILVSTCPQLKNIVQLPENIEVINRENIGYDFASYKEGIFSISNLSDYDELILLNDSFYVIRTGAIKEALQKMTFTRGDVWGMTASNQISFHLQSYFLVFKKNVFTQSWFQDFWKNLINLSDKKSIVLNYEIGLSKLMLNHSLSLVSLFTPTIRQKLTIYYRAAVYKTIKTYRQLSGVGNSNKSVVVHSIKRPSVTQLLNPFSSFSVFRCQTSIIQLFNPFSSNPLNLTHFLWDDIAYQLGLIKVDLLRDNRPGMSLNKLARIVDAKYLATIKAHCERVRKFYGFDLYN